MSFYNTIALKEPELRQAKTKARSQEDEIYCLMLRGGEFTASRLQKFFREWPITSIRRSLTDLSDDKKIERIDFVPSPHGSREGKYRAVKQVKLF